MSRYWVHDGNHFCSVFSVACKVHAFVYYGTLGQLLMYLVLCLDQNICQISFRADPVPYFYKRPAG